MVVAPVILAYFTAWSIYGRSYNVKDIPADKITHINYAFATIDSDGRIAVGDSWADTEQVLDGDTWNQSLRGNFNQLIQLKKKYPHLRTLISVGGWTWSTRFSDIAANEQSRSTFATSCLEFIQKYGFDGVDLNWKYPVPGGLPRNSRRPEDKQNHVLLLKELRRQMNTVPNKNYLLTVTTGAGAERIGDLDLVGMVKYLDWINVMTYGFHGGLESKTGHNASDDENDDETVEGVAPAFANSKYNCETAIQSYLSAGVPSQKILVGLPLYGRGWQGVTNQVQNGFSQSASNQLPTSTWENGVSDYDRLRKSYLPIYKGCWDDKSIVPFLYNPSTGTWISFDDLESTNIKNKYIKQKQLSEPFFWKLSSDRQTKLISSTFNVLSKDFSPPTSKIFPWKLYSRYYVGERVIYRGKIYSCIQKHVSSRRRTPDVTKSLWQIRSPLPTTTTKRTSTRKPTTTPRTTTNNNAPEWEPFKSYSGGDKVTYQGKIYQCRQAHISLTDWMPPAVLALWLRV